MAAGWSPYVQDGLQPRLNASPLRRTAPLRQHVHFAALCKCWTFTLVLHCVGRVWLQGPKKRVNRNRFRHCWSATNRIGYPFRRMLFATGSVFVLLCTRLLMDIAHCCAFNSFRNSFVTFSVLVYIDLIFKNTFNSFSRIFCLVCNHVSLVTIS